MSLKSSFARIHNVNAKPEQVFAAAMIVAAAEAAREGDCLAYQWINSPCSLRWLVAVTPADDSCERVRAALLTTIPRPRDLPSETPLCVVQLALELEV